MGSGSSQPKETQSAPATARATPKQQAPKRNRQFEEVQIAGQGGTTPRSRQQQQRPQGTSPHPNQAAAKTPRGQDPGASGSTSERTSRQQPPQASRQGAAANGRKPQPKSTNMPAQQVAETNDPGQISSGNLQGLMDSLNKVEARKRALNAVQEEPELTDNDHKAAGTVEPHGRPTGKKTPSTSVTNKQTNHVIAGLGGNQQRSQNKTNSITETEGQTGYKTKHYSPADKANGDKGPVNAKTEKGQIDGKKTRALKTSAKPGKAITGNDGSASNEGGKETNAGASNGAGPTQDGTGETKSNKTPASNRMEDDLSIDDDNMSYDRGEELNKSPEDNWDNVGQSTHSGAESQPAANQDRAETASMKDDDLVFETFYHRSGKEFQCIYQSGMRFYLDDWGSKEWQPFPKRWYNEGLLVTNTILKDDNAEQGRSDQAGGAASQGQSTSRSQGRSQGNSGGGGGGGGGNDDREGFLMHPTKGRVPTYIFYKKHNVHMYFDRDTGSWVRMPVGWELHHNMVKSLVEQVEEAVPTWGDRHDILSLLRACNYDPDECINIYLHLEKDEWMKAPKTSKENKVLLEKEARILDLEKRVKHLESQLQKEITTREEAERNLEEQMNKFSELEADSKETEAHLSAVTGGRPVSARPFSRMVKAGQKPGKGGKGAAGGMAAGSKTSSDMEAIAEEDNSGDQKDTKTDHNKDDKKDIKKEDKKAKKDDKKVEIKIVEVIKEVTREVEPQKVGEVVNPDDVLDLNANAKELRKAHTRVRMDVERYMGDLKHMMEKLAPSIKQLKQSEKGTQNEIEEVRALYRKEALQRKLLYNQLQELRGNIRVFCRIRKDDRAECCMKFPSDSDIVVQHPQQGKKIFSFDKVFEPNSTQEQVFEDTKPIITSCVDGYNVCLLAYGQTGSGKTFTMMGPESNPGINIRAMKQLFQVCAERTETMEYTLKVSLVEIYNETIQDLLTNDVKTLELRTAGNKVQIPGLIEYPIKNLDDVKKVMSMGDKNRSVASTKMNSTSSRSHLVLMLNVEGKDKVTGAISRGSLVLCDLAGSERISKTEAEGQRLVEAAAINKSLSALGQVFTALRSSQLHVPYRNSKLTQILQPSLGGDAKACLFVNASPDGYNFSESVSTLAFGSNARQVTLGQAKQNITKGK